MGNVWGQTGTQTDTQTDRQTHRRTDRQTQVAVYANRGSPLQTGTHFPRLKKRECSSLVKQMSDAAGVLPTHTRVTTHSEPQWLTDWAAQMIKLTTASCWSSTGASALVHLLKTWHYSSDADVQSCVISDGASVLTPDVRVIHTGLVIGQSDEGRVRGPLVNQLQQNLLVVDRQVVHILWPWREGGMAKNTENLCVSSDSQWEYSRWFCNGL